MSDTDIKVSTPSFRGMKGVEALLFGTLAHRLAVVELQWRDGEDGHVVTRRYEFAPSGEGAKE